ncbi:hypothetical protein [Methylobacter sp. BlB1]|uniref:hypothetical protein n=1 Tax=Methylobacter sp. BlB1 TaxID=2785914 RepID=UPI00189418DF|nr:hypothetical protein [Methylobacter sp. BlB1]MBF6647140.1 hypothetical protein [Methylobacter sp. BlB1]
MSDEIGWLNRKYTARDPDGSRYRAAILFRPTAGLMLQIVQECLLLLGSTLNRYG